MVAFKNIVKTGDYISFDIEHVNLGIVNSLRRAIMSDVEIVAPSINTSTGEGDFDFIANTSVLHNEFVAHRLSFIPIKLDHVQLKHFLPEHYQFRLKKKNTTKAKIYVTSKDIEVYDQTGTALPSSVRDKLFPHDQVTKDHIYIVPLHANLDDPQKGEELHVEYRAQKGTGQDHARWCPVHTCLFRNKVDPAKFKKRLASEIANNPKIDPAMVEKRLLVLDGQREYFTDSKGHPDVFEFCFHSICGLKPEIIVQHGLGKLKDMVAGLDSAIDEGRCAVTPMPNVNDMWQFTMLNTNSTLGNMIQRLLYESKDVAFVGFSQPHPLENKSILKIKYTLPGVDIREAFKKSLANIVDMLDDLIIQWNQEAGLV
jgi:DNA-directed RNA polymerase II subunit RPB3